MTEERIAQIEAAIAELGPDYSQRAVYRKVGGSHTALQAYLKAREATLPQAPSRRTSAPVDTAAVVAAMPQQAPSTLQEDLDAALEAEQAAEARLAQLEAQAVTQMLSEEEEVETIRLERRVRNLAAVITRLQTAVDQQKETLDIEAFVAAWLPTAQAKRQRYADFYQAARQLWVAFQAILSQHDAQVEGLMTLPPRLQRYMLDTFLPDRTTIAARLAGNMLDPQSWHTLLCGTQVGQVAPPEQLMQNDPGCLPLPPRLIQNALNQGRPIEMERSA